MSRYGKGVSVKIGGVRYFACASDLPPANAERWTPERKIRVVAAVEGGLITLEEACKRYRLDPSEIVVWKLSMERNGPDGVKIKHIQEFRK